MPTWPKNKKQALIPTTRSAAAAAVSRARRTRQSVGLACAVCIFAISTITTAPAVVGAQSAGDPPLNASSAPATATTAPSLTPAAVSLTPSPSPSSSASSSTEPTEPTTPMANDTESPVTQTPEPITASPKPTSTPSPAPVTTTAPPPPTLAPVSSSPSPAPALTPISTPSATPNTEKPPTTTPAQSPVASPSSPAPSSTQSRTVQPSITAKLSTESTKPDTPAPSLMPEKTTSEPPAVSPESPAPAVPEQSPAPPQAQSQSQQSQQTAALVASEQDKETVTTMYNSTTLPPGIDATVLDGGELVNVETTAKTQNGQTSVSYTIVVKKGDVIESVQQPGFNTSDPNSAMLPSSSDIVSNSTDIGSSQLGSKSSSSLSSGATIALVLGALVVGVLVSGFFMKRRNRNKNKKADGLAGARTPSSNKSTARTIEEGYSSLESFHMDMDRRGTINRARQSSHGSDYSTRPSPRHRSNGSLWEDSVIVAARIPFDKVQVGKLLSRGGFGEVYQGTYREQQVAIKKLPPETRKDLQHIENFLSEIKLQASLDHPHIVAFLGVAWESLSELYAISEFMERGDLRSLLMTYNQPGSGVPRGFSLEKVKIALHIAHALTYLHSLQPQILHRDLKSRNILLTSRLDAKLTDFGSSCVRSDGDLTMTAGVGSSLWMAPEVMVGKHYDEKSDVFSLGIVLSELDTHELPYSHTKEPSSGGGENNSTSRSGGGGRSLPDTAILQLVSMGRLQVQFSRNCPPEMVALAQRCIEVDPKERPTAAEVLYQLHVVLRMFEKQ